ncbi:hypothetical protein EYC80_007501 [Monilinia laxa]|uniref:FAD-binding PCMH-type domain-containing protein n=1 Tax=Monilinia laxa TaxID=61186 RepID=A0A5N6JW45_MONLA|nr:hypothetical protein EYC80_007501 [Monilinia laxa]
MRGQLVLCQQVAVIAHGRPLAHPVIVIEAVLMKELSTALSGAGRCTVVLATGTGNTVGVIPFCLGGGISTFSGAVGFECDQILAAKIITADGTLVHTSAEAEPELLWAIKGADQVGNFLDPLDRANNVCGAMERLMTSKKYNTSGIMMTMVPPPAFQPMLVFVPQFMRVSVLLQSSLFGPKHVGLAACAKGWLSKMHDNLINSPEYSGDAAEAPHAFQALTGLHPIMSSAFGNDNFENQATAAMRDGDPQGAFTRQLL